MNKKDSVKLLSKKINLTQKECAKCLNALLEIWTQSMLYGDSVVLANFGKFYPKYYKSRLLHNPKTRTKSILPQHYAPVFKSSMALKKRFWVKNA